MTGGRRWSPEEDARLTELVRDGKTHAEIGAIIGRTRNAVNLRASFLGATMAPDAVRRHRRDGLGIFYSDAERLAIRAAKYSRTFGPERRRALAEKMRGNKRAVGSWDGKTYPESAKRLISAIRSRQHAKAIGVPRDHPMRAIYVQLRQKVGADEARRIFRDELARLPAFEQQMLKVQLGGTLSRKIETPTKTYNYTLGGVSA